MTSGIIIGSTAAITAATALCVYRSNKTDSLANSNWEKIRNGIKDDSSALWNTISFNGAKNIEPKKTIFNLGFNEAERNKAIAINEYDTINKKYNSLIAEQGSQGNSNLQKKIDEAFKELQLKKKQLEEASTQFSKYGSENFNKISDSLADATVATKKKANDEGNKLLKLWEKSIPDSDKIDDKVDLIAGKSVTGWGETAEELGREEIREHVLFKGDKPSLPQQKLNEIKELKDKGWFNYEKSEKTAEQIAENTIRGLEGWGESAAQFAKDEYDDLKWQLDHSKSHLEKLAGEAKTQLDSAQRQFDNTQDKWWDFIRSKDEQKKELQRKASSELNKAKENYNEVLKKLEQVK